MPTAASHPAAAGALHRLDEDTAERAGLDGGDGRLGVVPLGDGEVVGRVERAARHAGTTERQHATVVALVEHENTVTTGVMQCGADRHQIGLGAGVREAHLVERRKALAQQRRQPGLVFTDGTDRPALVERGDDRIADDRFGLAEEPGGVVPAEVDSP